MFGVALESFQVHVRFRIIMELFEMHMHHMFRNGCNISHCEIKLIC